MRLASLCAALALMLVTPTAAPQTLTSSLSNASPVIGTFTVATLPSCADNQGKYAFVTDLGGGPDMLICAGGYWKHIRLGTPINNPATTSFDVVPLVSAPIQIIDGNIVGAMTISITGATLYPGYILYVRRPGLLNVGASIGVRVGNGSVLPVLGQSTAIFVYNGATLVQVQ